MARFSANCSPNLNDFQVELSKPLRIYMNEMYIEISKANVNVRNNRPNACRYEKTKWQIRRFLSFVIARCPFDEVLQDYEYHFVRLSVE